MKRFRPLRMLLITWTLAACASRAAVPEPVTDPSRWTGDPRLYHMLNTYPLTAAQRDSIEAYVTEHAVNANELLAEPAQDEFAPATVRANALLVLAERKAVAHFPVFRAALDDPDPRVRATAVAAMREFIENRPNEAVRIARTALNDADPTVQAQALPIIGDHDIAALRAYAQRTTNAELRAVAHDLVRVAEERGAPLAGDSASGVLRRTTAHEYELTFAPTQRWPSWDAAVGDVTIQRAGRTIATLRGIEAVAGVVPVFFSTSGSHIVYERRREIVVRELATGTERVLGAGIAPRPLPFSDSFVFVREMPNGRTDMRERTRIAYVVLQAPFGGDAAEPKSIGSLNATTAFQLHGNYSPVRWMRVEEQAGNFFLSGANIDRFALPDPFGTGAPS